MAECVAEVAAHVNQEQLDAILKEAGPLNLTPGQWLKRKLVEITGIPSWAPERRKKPVMLRMLYVRLPKSAHDKMLNQAAVEGLSLSRWMRRAIERDLEGMHSPNAEILLEPPMNDLISKYPVVQCRAFPELRARVAARAKANCMSQGTWVRAAIMRELGLFGQIPLELLEASQVSEEPMPMEEWDNISEGTLAELE